MDLIFITRFHRGKLHKTQFNIRKNNDSIKYCKIACKIASFCKLLLYTFLFLYGWHSVDSKEGISLYKETCFLTVHMTLETLILELTLFSYEVLFQ